MNKAELIMKVSERASVTQKVAKGHRRHALRWDEGKPGKWRTD